MICTSFAKPSTSLQVVIGGNSIEKLRIFDRRRIASTTILPYFLLADIQEMIGVHKRPINKCHNIELGSKAIT